MAEADRQLKAVEAEHSAAREERVRCEGALQQAEHDREELTAHPRAHRLRPRKKRWRIAEASNPAEELPGKEQIATRLERLVRERDTMGPVNLPRRAGNARRRKPAERPADRKDDLVQAIARLRQGIAASITRVASAVMARLRDGQQALPGTFVQAVRRRPRAICRWSSRRRRRLPGSPEGAAADDAAPVPSRRRARHEDPLEAGARSLRQPAGQGSCRTCRSAVRWRAGG